MDISQFKQVINVAPKAMPVKAVVTSYRIKSPLNTSITIIPKEQLDGRFQ
mgnify:CR=1 FL=1